MMAYAVNNRFLALATTKILLEQYEMQFSSNCRVHSGK